MQNYFSADEHARCIAAVQHHEDTKSFAEKRDETEHRLPYLFKRDYAFSQLLLKSSLFRPATGSRAAGLKRQEVQTATADKVFLSGEELRQDDQTVLLAVLKEMQGKLVADSGATSYSFHPVPFARDVLGWPKSGQSTEKLLECIQRLKTSHLEIHYQKGGRGTLSFFADFDCPKGGEWKVYLSPKLLEMFERHATTYLRIEEHRVLKEGLQTWLLGFINADSCADLFDVAEVQRLAGDARELKEFGRVLRKALEVLLDHGQIASFSLHRGKLRITRK